MEYTSEDEGIQFRQTVWLLAAQATMGFVMKIKNVKSWHLIISCLFGLI